MDSTIYFKVFVGIRILLGYMLKADEITDLQLLDQTFPGGRPTTVGKRLKWDKLFIRVKPATHCS